MLHMSNHDKAEFWTSIVVGTAVPVKGASAVPGVAGRVSGALRAVSADTAVDAASVPGLLKAAAGGGGRSLPMTMDTVCDMACRYGIDISDVPITINKGRIGYAGSTSPSGAVTLTRSAFRSEEQLARTLARERFHVGQIRSGMPYPTTYDAASPWERAAQEFEDAWWEDRQ
jgi:hypothetical protein